MEEKREPNGAAGNSRGAQRPQLAEKERLPEYPNRSESERL